MITFSRLGQFGRLGNQLFQIASTVGIAHQNSSPYVFPKWEYRDYFPGFLYNGCDYGRLPGDATIYDYQDTAYKEIHLDANRNWDLVGYLQSEKYFEEVKPAILRLFKSNSMELVVDKIAVHIRRGDFVRSEDPHINLDLDYYRQALDLLPRKRVTIFSDDIEWCKRWTGAFPDADFMPAGNPITDLFYMASHMAFVTANSSFSWWGAWLGESVHKVEGIVTPRRWYKTLDNRDLIPDRWIAI